MDKSKKFSMRFDEMIKLYGEKKLNHHNINMFCLLEPRDYNEIRKIFLKNIEFIFWSTSQKRRDLLFKDIDADIKRNNLKKIIVCESDSFRERINEILSINLRKNNTMQSFIKILTLYMDLLFLNSNFYSKNITVASWRYGDKFFIYCGNNKYNSGYILKKYDSFLESHVGKPMKKQLIVFLTEKNK